MTPPTPASRFIHPVHLTVAAHCPAEAGPGAWTALLRYRRHTRQISGRDPAATNAARLELQATLAALQSTARLPGPLHLLSGSPVLQHGVLRGLKSWKSRRWLTPSRQPVRHRDLWEALDALLARQAVHWLWEIADEKTGALPSGHLPDPELAHCRLLAAEEYEKLPRPAGAPAPALAPAEPELPLDELSD